QDYPQVLVNADASDEIKKTYKENKNISKAIDNLLEKHPDYRILIRPSGTEKFVRIMIEGSPIGEIIVEANNLKAIIEKEN
ncbi:MAG: phosphoglucosamine mutase, partial [Ezakiella massiliensis]